ncbi:alpha-L-fucosidase [Flammeovirga pacifica]|uniref:alpha-L-fucosidase n=2 Tax=Flammeovirga pacifica TaxID=915059 RepID=A0A1S1YUV2_FLAPC|nr:alpha-L-fucosidase [Flammeovirga pacifica]
MMLFNKNSILVVLLLLLIQITTFAQKEGAKDENMDEMWGRTTVKVDALKEGRGELFADGNFGMFVHWGLYSHLGGKWNGKTYYGIGEWLLSPRVADIPVEEYKKVAESFNPTEFDAKKIAQLAKDAGMKYIIITSKHHEGFAMFDSEVSDFNIVDATPFGRDPMHELSEACHELGLGFGFYYSHYQDWTTAGGGKSKIEGGDFKDYFYNKCKPQVKEICTNYGDIDFIWFDTPGGMKKEYIVELAGMVRELQPNVMLCSRVGHGLGDYASRGDMEVPERNYEGLWESADTNNDSWSYAWYDNNFKGPKAILHRLVSTIGRGGTYLLNVGPNSKGSIPEIGVTFLEEAGRWINKYPQVIYGAGSSPWGHALPWGDVTTQGNTLYLSVFDWPQDGKLYLPGLQSKIISTSILNGDNKEEISFEQQDEWAILNVPNKPVSPLVTVIAVDIDTEAKSAKVDQTFGIYPNTETHLLTEFAEVSNAEKKSIRWMEKFGEWLKTTQVSKWEENGEAEWTVEVKKPGYYHLNLCHKGEGRLVWKTVTDEGALIQNQQAATEKYQTYPMGIIEFKTAGKHKVKVSLVEGDAETSSLKYIAIEPIVSESNYSEL